MSARLDTTPWFTKNFAAGWLVTRGVSSGHGGWTVGPMVPHGASRDDPIVGERPDPDQGGGATSVGAPRV